MVFSGSVFIMIFLPAVFLLYNLFRSNRAKNILLTAASLLFYSFGEPFTVFIMVLSVLVNFILGLLTNKAENAHRKIFLILSVIWNLALLGVYKYAGFFAEMINLLPLVDIPVPQIHLPIGISFFTFQSMSYVIDLYRGKINVQKSFMKLLLYISFFPQLIAGPIVKYGDIEAQLDERIVSAETAAVGIRRFIFGLSKKLLIADTISAAADLAFSLPREKLSFVISWIGALCYTLQIYFDFSGYSDMAIGLGKMFGFDFPENFNYPYCSSSITEFWRRWHISLSSWFRDYLYIPLGGSRKGSKRTILNKWIVFLCTGLWHGANLTFVLWGIANGFFITIETLIGKFKDKIQHQKLLKNFGHFYTVISVTFCFALFRAESISQIKYYIPAMFGFSGITQAQRNISISLLLEKFTPLFILTLIFGILFSTPILPKLGNKISGTNTAVKNIFEIILYVISILLFALCLMSIASGTYSPFIYFNF